MSHILYVNPTAIHGGAEEALFHTMCAAQEIGYQPVLIVPHAGWLTDRCKERGIPSEILLSLPDTMVTEHWREQFSPWLLNGIAIAQLARKWQAVLVHSNTPRSSYHGGLGARFAGIGAVTHIHDIVNLPYSSATRARLLYALADWMLVPSEAVAKAVRLSVPWADARLQVVYYGWDITVYENTQAHNLREMYKLPTDSLLIGSVSAMTSWKGQDILISAFQQLYSNDPRLRLFIVGSAQGSVQQRIFEESLHRKVTESGLQEAVIFTGWREDGWSFIKNFDIFVHVPTKPDPLPTVVLHALALNSAIVGSNTGGIPEMVLDGKCGLIIPPSSIDQLAHAIFRLIENPGLRAEFQYQAGCRFRQFFTKAQMSDRLRCIYNQVSPL